MMLSKYGPLGEEVTEQYPQFKSVLTKKFNETTASISIDHALTAFGTKNPNVTKAEIDKLKSTYDIYNSCYEENLKSYLKGYGSYKRNNNIGDLVRKIKQNARDAKSSISNSLTEVLAGVFSLWTIITSETMFEDTKDSSCLIRPHAVQLIAIFRLLGMDKSNSIFDSILNLIYESKLNGHLIEVGTGEGKSILLGGLSCVLSLLDFDVYCASYSKHLSSRDYEAFLPLFKQLDVSNKIHYSTLSELAEIVINSKGDIRNAVNNFLLSKHTNTYSSHLSHSRSKTKRILLIDEVDVFFSPDFFGSTYNPVSRYCSNETQAIFSYIWNNKPRKVQLQEIQQLQEYVSLISSFRSEAVNFINQQINYIINDCDSNYNYFY